MPRFYCPDLVDQRAIVLDDEQAKHAVRVLRLRAGDAVELFDGRGRVAQGVLADAGGALMVEVGTWQQVEPPRPAIELAVAMPKAGRADDMVSQLAQLGVDRLIPLRTQRTIVEPRDAKLDRLHRIAIEAARQCGRSHLMAIDQPSDLPAFIAREPSEAATLHLVAAIDPVSGIGTQALKDRLTDVSRVVVCIGPEGGWTEQEIGSLTAAGYLPWRLNPHTLRIATAACTAAAILRWLGESV